MLCRRVVGHSACRTKPEEVTVSQEISSSQTSSELDVLKSELKALKQTMEKIQQRLDQIEEELTSLRNLL